MPRNKSAPVNTPGVAPEVEPDSSAETDMDALEAGAEPLDDGAAGEADAGKAAKGGKAAANVTMSPDQLQAMIDAAVSKAVQARTLPSPPVAEAELPDQSEIDPKKITRPTLSKQGYVVPANYGDPASNGIKRI